MTISATTQGLRMGVATSSSRPTVPFDGQVISETDTDSLQVYKGTAWAPVSGLTFITGATFTTATNFSLPANTFSATYKNYRILINITATTSDATFTMRLRAAGTDSTGSNYQFGFYGITGTGAADSASSGGTTSWTVGEIDAVYPFYTCALDIMQPQATAFTSALGGMAFIEEPAVYSVYRAGGAWLQLTTSFDSLTFISSVASSITGTYRVYGYSES